MTRAQVLESTMAAHPSVRRQVCRDVLAAAMAEDLRRSPVLTHSSLDAAYVLDGLECAGVDLVEWFVPTVEQRPIENGLFARRGVGEDGK